MNAEQWRDRLGGEAWEYIFSWDISSAGGDDDYEPGAAEDAAAQIVAGVLTRAAEVGFVAPQGPVQVSRGGTAVQAGDIRALTSKGLLEHWKAKGHGWMLFRLEPLMKAVAGPLLPHLQQIWLAYEAQCAEDGLEKHQIVPADWFGFVGGEGPLNWGYPDDIRALTGGLSEPVLNERPELERRTVSGPK